MIPDYWLLRDQGYIEIMCDIIEDKIQCHHKQMLLPKYDNLWMVGSTDMSQSKHGFSFINKLYLDLENPNSISLH